MSFHRLVYPHKQAVRRAWNLPDKRDVLSSVSNIMLCGEVDIHPDFGAALARISSSARTNVISAGGGDLKANGAGSGTARCSVLRCHEGPSCFFGGREVECRAMYNHSSPRRRTGNTWFFASCLPCQLMFMPSVFFGDCLILQERKNFLSVSAGSIYRLLARVTRL